MPQRGRMAGVEAECETECESVCNRCGERELREAVTGDGRGETRAWYADRGGTTRRARTGERAGREKGTGKGEHKRAGAAEGKGLKGGERRVLYGVSASARHGALAGVAGNS